MKTSRFIFHKDVPEGMQPAGFKPLSVRRMKRDQEGRSKVHLLVRKGLCLLLKQSESAEKENDDV